MSGESAEQKTARSVGDFIGEGDIFAKGLGVRLVDIGPGRARVEMTVRQDMSNAARIGHGGATFTLADTAFAYACNSRNRLSLATSCTVTFTGQVALGDVLSAEAREVSLQGRSGVYDIQVTNQNGQVVALFRGHSRQVKGSLVKEDC